MKTHQLPLAIISYLAITFIAFGQSTPTHEKKIYTNDEDKVFVNKSLPLYLSISTSPDGKDGTVLKGQDPTYSYPMYLDTEGYNSIRTPWKVNPETGETIYPREEVIFEVYADATAPNVSVSFNADSKLKEEGIWKINGREVELTSKDAISGVQNTYYSIDGGSFQIYSTPIKLPEDKTYSINYYSVDNVGNAGEPKEVKVQPDQTAPTTSYELEGDQSEQVVSARTKIVLKASDDIVGVSKTFYQIDEGSTFPYSRPISLSGLNEGEHTITYFSSDKVGNIEEKKSATFYVDKSAPRIISEVIGNTFLANGKEYYSGRTKLKLVAMDNKAGVSEIQYSVNNGDFVKYTAPFYLKEAGSLNISVKAVDKVNNEIVKAELSDKDKLRAYVDLSGPDLDYSVKGPSFKVKDTLLVNKETTISLSGIDNESGFKEIDYQLNSGGLQTYSEPFSIEDEGLYTITFNGYDNLQNSNSRSIIVRSDNTGPEVFHRFSVLSNKKTTIEGVEYDVYPTHAILFLSATDGYAGLNEVTYQVNGGASLAYRGLIQNFKEGSLYTISAQVKDKLGNANTKEIKFFVE